VKLKDAPESVKELCFTKIRAADAKEVGVGNPAEETYCHPNDSILLFCNFLSISYHSRSQPLGFASFGFAPANFIVRPARNGMNSQPQPRNPKGFRNPENRW
jgi:hypothetical protein